MITLISSRMDDLIKSFKAQMYDRVTSPLLSSFLISWALWNHRLFVVILSSDLKLKDKFNYVDNVLYPGLYEVGLRGFIWPLLSALALIFLYPIPGRWVYEHVRNEQKKLKFIQQRIDDETPLTREEERKLKAAIRKVDADSQRELDARDERIKALTKDVDDRDERITALNRQLAEAMTKLAHGPRPSADLSVRDNEPILRNGELVPEPDPTLNNIQLSLLHKIAGSREGIDIESAEKASGTDLILTQHSIDELLKLNLIKRLQGYNGRPSRYQATAAGRAILVRAGVV